MSIAASLPRAAAETGLRRFDAGRDIPGVVELLESAFGADLLARDRQWLAELSRVADLSGRWMGPLARVLPQMVTNLGGFVVERDGRIVANASLMRARDDVWAVANVVTRPEYRRRGLALGLMRRAIDEARMCGAREVQLDVRDDNQPAQRLYAQLGFRATTAMTWLLGQTGRVVAPNVLAAPPAGATLVRWNRRDREEIHAMARRAERSGSAVSRMLREGAEGGMASRMAEWFSEGMRYRLAVSSDGLVRAVGLGIADAPPDGHKLALVVDPLWRGRFEVALVSALLAAMLGRFPADVQAEVGSRDVDAITVLEEAGFERQRTLDRLVLRLT